jgi:hypothetical protein
MRTHRPNSIKFTLIACIALFVLLFALNTSAAQVINFKKLVPFVDLKIPGWTMEGKPGGSTVGTGPGSASEAKAKFKSGDKTLEVSITDLHGRHFHSQMRQFMQMFNEQAVRSFDVQGFKAFEHYNKIYKQGDLIIGVANRFLVRIKGQGIDNPKVLQEVAQQMDLKKLATLTK